jgi:Tfp pilus assembly protein PilW
MRAIVRRVRRDESGLSMTELLVGMVLSTVILILVTSLFVNVTKMTTVANQNRLTTGSAANTAKAITSVIGVATTKAIANQYTPDPAVVAGSRDMLQIYSLANTDPKTPAPSMYTFAIESTSPVTNPVTYQVRETKCTGTASGGYWSFSPCATTTTRIIGSDILLPTSTANQLFTYKDQSGNDITLAAATTQLTPAQRATVGSIVVTVRTQLRTTNAPAPVVVSNTVVLRNLGLETDE